MTVLVCLRIMISSSFKNGRKCYLLYDVKSLFISFIFTVRKVGTSIRGVKKGPRRLLGTRGLILDAIFRNYL